MLRSWVFGVFPCASDSALKSDFFLSGVSFRFPPYFFFFFFVLVEFGIAQAARGVDFSSSPFFINYFFERSLPSCFPVIFRRTGGRCL